jgi:hypothetical protein
MTEDEDRRSEVAALWCEAKGGGWQLGGKLGEGGTATVFEVLSPEGVRSLKIYSSVFSVGKKGDTELKRIEKQLELKGHDCGSLVQVYEGAKSKSGCLF